MSVVALAPPSESPAPLARAEAAVEELLEVLGEDPHREGLLRTPARVARALADLTAGYALEPADVVGEAIFSETSDEPVVVSDIEFHSLCEHHMLPFHGRAHIAYLPAGKVIGLSKLPRLFDVYARRLQVQERLTRQVAEALAAVLQPRGVGVRIEASHSCMTMRGVQKQSPWTTTSCLLGAFRTDPELRAALPPARSLAAAR